MIGLPIGLIFAGYAVGSWGYVLVKGYNITLREWFSPLHPYSGSLASAGMVPQGSIFPASAKGAAATQQGGNPVQRQQHRNLAGGAPSPHGTVQ